MDGDASLEASKKIRKPMPPPTQIIGSRKDKRKRWDYRDELEDSP